MKIVCRAKTTAKFLSHFRFCCPLLKSNKAPSHMNLLILFVASSLFEWAELVLAFTEANEKKGFEFQRHLRADARSTLTAKVFLPFPKQYQDFPYSELKAFLTEHFKGKRQPHQQNLRYTIKIPTLNDQYRDIAYYLAMLEIDDGSLFDAAYAIDMALKKNNNEFHEMAQKSERGQFLLWSEVLPSVKIAATNFFRTSTDVQWRNKVLERYQKFLDTRPTEAAGRGS
ncbi:hypothetical protein PsorP6_001618 [Peronosclerospora sorghi]|uniref:Uncharacterized protein n=1 Tax=Peronosclerospora sorghi TaxID=230839 RepID=A0ACC0WY68_9STRA|nr:hypothetical protein PsorP6_001618 [Peronosclerospora sorghi]